MSKKELERRTSRECSGNCTLICGSLVQRGENVAHRGVCEGSIADISQVGEIISIEDRRCVNRTELSRCSVGRGPERDRLVLVRTLAPATGRKRTTNRRSHPNVPDSPLELTITNSFKWILAVQVESIAFVFHADGVNSGKFLCGGMVNAFVVRQIITEDGEIKTLRESEFDPFKTPPSAKETHSKRIWSGLAALNEASFEVLSSGGKWDGRTKHLHLPGFNFELAMCLMDRLTIASDVIQDDVEFSRAKKRLNADLSVSNKRIKTKGRLIRVLEQTALIQFRSALGSTFGVANAKAVPALKEVKKSNGRVKDTAHVCDHDLVRIVTCAEDDFDNDSNKDVAPLLVTSDGGNQRDALADIKALKRQPRRLPYPGIDSEVP